MNIKKYLFAHITGDIKLQFALAPAALSSVAGTSAAAFAAGAAPVSIAAQLGGGSLLAGLGGLSGISTAFSIGSTILGGISESRNLKAQANAERFNARNREIDRKRNLIRSLALQNVRIGASGITAGTGSSAQAVQLEDISRAETDQATDTASTNQRVSMLKQNAKAATTFSLLSAAGEGVRFARRQTKRGSV